jgi:hypothetical protein
VDTIAAIIKQWKAEQIQLNSPATPDVIRRAEEIIGYHFSSDFIEIYLIVDGFNNLDCRSNMFSLWPLQRIIDEYLEGLAKNNNASTYQQGQAENFVGFCDYLINSHQIGFLKDRTGVYKSYDEFNPIAESFCEALLLINKDADSIY